MGFIVLFFGILIFNEIIILPFLKMKNKTRYERPDSPYSPGAYRRMLGNTEGNDIAPMIIISSEPNLGLAAGRYTARLGGEGAEANQDAPPPHENINATVDEPTEDGDALKNDKKKKRFLDF